MGDSVTDFKGGAHYGSVAPGTLYIVATPIGNLGDLSPRSVQVLNEVSLIAAEDTRHSQRLKKAHAIKSPMMALHAHNEAQAADRIVQLLQEGRAVALISDAGTPLISDPGSWLLSKVHALGLPVSPIPGPCAAIAALSVAGLATDRFVFEGFLPAKSAARLQHLQAVCDEMRTMVYYEAPHRLLACLEDMQAVFGATRSITLASELTKIHERVVSMTLGEALCHWQKAEAAPKGEWVLVVAGQSEVATAPDELTRLLRILLAECTLKQAVKIAVQCTQLPKNQVYAAAIAMQPNASR